MGENVKIKSVMMVPNSKGGRLVQDLLRIEPSLARRTGYTIKVAENSRIQLSILFNRVFMENNCGRKECEVCRSSNGTKKSKCKKTNVVYEATCKTC